jgi:hypothetical protein
VGSEFITSLRSGSKNCHCTEEYPFPYGPQDTLFYHISRYFYVVSKILRLGKAPIVLGSGEVVDSVHASERARTYFRITQISVNKPIRAGPSWLTTVHPDHGFAAFLESGDQIASNESGRAGNEYCHAILD